MFELFEICLRSLESLPILVDVDVEEFELVLDGRGSINGAYFDSLGVEEKVVIVDFEIYIFQV